jgi:hypothetical protein
MEPIKLTWEQWLEQFKPIANLFNQDAPYDGLMFETYGDEHSKVQELAGIHPLRVWTVVEGDEGDLVITNGYHYVNRIGYFITELPAESDKFYEIEP